MLNRVELIGNLGAAPELRHTSGGSAVCDLRIATSERVKRGESWEDHTEWHSVTVWGRRAETIAQHLDKGSRVFVAGKLRTEKWEKDGVSRSTTKVLADEVLFLSPTRSGSGGGPSSSGGGGYGAPPSSSGGGYRDDEIPF